jgi:hydrogenase nickel incorporation protein HypB
MSQQDKTNEHKYTVDEKMIIAVEEDILSRNNIIADENKGYFKAKNIFCLNLMSSPGSGKTSLLEETIRRIKGQVPVYVIEGDQQTTNDADRIAALEVSAYQVNTGMGCHLEADMIKQALQKLNPDDNALVFIENVGNLVCPAMYDLGEAKKVVIISTTEGDDKPLKYPYMFQEADVCVINKIDLAPYLDTDINKLRDNALKVNHKLRFFEVSATKGAGMDNWCDWLLNDRR